MEAQLLHLLNENRDNPIVADCLELISRPDGVRDSGSMVGHLEMIRSAYAMQAQRDAELNGGEVEGFDDLLSALKASSDLSVKLHPLEFISHWYVVFTDESTSRLHGILKSPKNNIASNDSARSYEG
jgi:hypothetical protein